MSHEFEKIAKYQKLVNDYPQLFHNDFNKHSIKIVTEEDEMIKQQIALYEKALSANKPKSWYDLGLLAEDSWTLVLRDLVIFPGGNYGCYIRKINRVSALKRVSKDVVIFPIYNGKILLLRHFRHEIRDWMWEIPRGFGEENQTAEENAIREVKEETGLLVENIQLLNKETTNNSERVAYFYANVKGNLTLENKESIMAIKTISKSEFETMILSGEITDSYTLYAFVLALLHGLI